MLYKERNADVKVSQYINLCAREEKGEKGRSQNVD